MWACLSVVSIYRPPQPPSLPPFFNETFAIVGKDARVKLQYQYEWKEGFIGSGGDVVPPATTTVHEALQWCDVDARCRGITYAGAKNATQAKVYWKMNGGVSKTAGWSTWLKHAKQTPPALTIEVGGSSRLELPRV